MSTAKIENVEVGCHETGPYWLSCDYDGARYHVWLDRKTRQVAPTLYKNPPRDLESRDDGYFKTRKLRVDSVTGTWMVASMMQRAELSGMFAAAEQRVADDMQADQVKYAELAKVVKVREAAPDMAVVLLAIHRWYEDAGYNGNGPSGAALLFDDDATLGTRLREALTKAGLL